MSCKVGPGTKVVCVEPYFSSIIRRHNVELYGIYTIRRTTTRAGVGWVWLWETSQHLQDSQLETDSAHLAQKFSRLEDVLDRVTLPEL